MPSTVQPKKTYYACTDVLLVTAVTKDLPWFVLGGSATKRIRLQCITISCPTLTAIELTRIELQKTSTATTGGTKTDLVKVPAEKDQGASTASLCAVYTAAPTRGTLIGAVASRRVVIPTATPVATDGVRQDLVFDFREIGEEGPPTLDLVAENLVLCFVQADAGSAVSMMLEVRWTEEG